jgi:hypothetical protein
MLFTGRTLFLALALLSSVLFSKAQQLSADPPWYDFYPQTIFALGAGFSFESRIP